MPQKNTYQFSGFSPRVYLTLDDLRADTDLPGDEDGPQLAVLTGTVAFDVTPAGLYCWNKDSAAADNATSILKPTGTDGDGRWIRIVS